MSIHDENSVRLDEAEIIAQAHRLRAEAMAEAIASLAAWMKVAAAPLLRWRERLHIASELNQLTDVELADMGITRGDIGRVAAGTYIDERPRRARPAPHNNNDRRRLAA